MGFESRAHCDRAGAANGWNGFVKPDWRGARLIDRLSLVRAPGKGNLLVRGGIALCRTGFSLSRLRLPAECKSDRLKPVLPNASRQLLGNTDLLKHTNIPLRFLRAVGILVAAPILAGALSLAARADDQDKKTKEKKEKPDIWVEIRTPQFVVTSDGGESGARKVLHDFDTLRRVIVATMPGARTGTGIPIQILAARDAQGFTKLFPEFPADKRHEQPNGQFIPGAEKLFIAIRTNVSGRMPYDEIYRDYARLILKLSYRNLPPWLVEGYECDALSFDGVEKGIATLADRARTGKLSLPELSGGTFSITNGGIYGSMMSTPLLNYPQTGILGMHNIVKRALVVGDEIKVRPMMYVALSYDHRVVDGREAVSFLVAVKERLEAPDRMLLEV